MYVQCKDDSETEKHVLKHVLKNGNAGFVTEDFRVYDKIEFWDKVSRHTLDAEIVNALIDLRDNIEFLGDDAERSFGELVNDSKLAQASFKRCQAILKKRKV